MISNDSGIYSIENISLSKKGKQSGKNNPFYGKHHSKESIEKNRQAHLGKSSPRKGAIASVETREKQSAARKAYWENKKRGEPNE